MSLISAVETQDWVWFEEGLAYDNARLPQALIVTGISLECGPLRGGWLEILALAHDAADIHGPESSGLSAPTVSVPSASCRSTVRSAAARGRGDDLGLPRGLARGRRSQVEG